MFYRLGNDCLLVNSNDCANIYQLSTGMVYNINNIQKEIISLLEQNYSIEEIKENFSLKNIIDLIKMLNKHNDFFSKRVYIDRIKPINMKMVKLNKTSITNINRIGFEITGACNLNCVFCSKDNVIYRKCGCKQWNSSFELSDKKWDDIISQAIKIGVKEVIISGGEPLLRLELVRLICKEFFQFNIKVKMFTNATLINDDIAKMLKDYNVDLAIHIISNNKDTYEHITGIEGSFKSFKEGLDYIQKYKINAIGILLVNKYNENEVGDINIKLDNLPIEVQHIYENSDCYSSKYIDQIYNRQLNCVNVNLFNYQILIEYNNCVSVKDMRT
jgi:sulfatase maturation enzyme AslB (radical SAM superfamily)